MQRLLPGVWKLQAVGGQPAAGWLTFSDDERGRRLTFSLVCGWQDGSYTLEGDTVRPALATSVGPNCSPEDLASSTVRAPALLGQPFRVNVGGGRLLVRGPRSAWATYVRSSLSELREDAQR